MRSYQDRSVFFQKMKKKPALEKIITELDSYTVEQLQGLSQPKWIREELIKLKSTKRVEQVLADYNPVIPEQKQVWYEVRIASHSFELKSNADFTYVIEENDPFLVIEPLVVKWGHLALNLRQDQITSFLNNTTKEATMELNEYNAWVSDRTTAKNPNPDQIIDLNSKPFTITRLE